VIELSLELRRELDALLGERYQAACSAATAYVRSQAARILEAVGFWALPCLPRSAGEIADKLGLAEPAVRALLWLLEEVAVASEMMMATPSGDSPVFAPRGPLPRGYWDSAREVARAHCRDLGESIAMIDYAAERYPDFLRGRRSGVSVMLKGEGLDRLERYFSEWNPLYSVYNEIGGLGLREAIRTLDRPARVLELGAGTGGATRILLGTLARSGGRLLATDIAPSLLMRQAGRVPPGDRCAWQRLDFDRPFDPQGIDACSQDVVVSVNGLHNASDPSRTLGFVRRALSRRGVLVIAESLCPPGERVHQDFLLNLLPAGPARGRSSRFLEPSRWEELLREGSFEAALHVNTDGRPLAMLALARPRSGSEAPS
jgi:SAM-dependent methyltransferase